ncbi:hypothetical protein F5883DRAFT_596991 [Diaporthe sp. PMI_573]|nr:hypothetical protein F5883DRAFT_596991 [Diaporthaceae sp. PMI_573]
MTSGSLIINLYSAIVSLPVSFSTARHVFWSTSPCSTGCVFGSQSRRPRRASSMGPYMFGCFAHMSSPLSLDQSVP